MSGARECLGRDAVVWRESPSVALGTRYGDGIEAQYGVSCTGWLAKERGGDVGRARVATLRGLVMGVQKQRNPLSEPSCYQLRITLTEAVRAFMEQLEDDPITSALDELADELVVEPVASSGRVLIDSGVWQW